MKLLDTFVLAILVLLNFGCDQSEDEEGEAPGEFFLNSDILAKPNAPRSFDSAGIIEAMNEESEFYTNQPKEAGDSNSDQCIQNKLNQVELVVNGKKFHVALSGDFAECFQNTFGEDIKVESLSSPFKMYSEYECTSDAFDQFVGKNLQQIEEQNLFCPDLTGRQDITFSISAKLAYTKASDSATFTIDSNENHFVGTSNFGKCRVTQTDTSIVNDNCVEIFTGSSKTETVVNGESKTEEYDTWKKFTYSNGFTNDRNNTSIWHSKGRIDIEYGNWAGRLDYTNAATPPTYEISNGTEILKGSLTVTAGLQEIISNNLKEASKHIENIIQSNLSNYPQKF